MIQEVNMNKQDTRRDAWNYDYLGPKKDVTVKYHDWVYMADDQMNKVLKFAVVSVYAYGGYIVAVELVNKFL